MWSRGVSANVFSCNASFSASLKGQQWQCALRLLEEMRSGCIWADVISYSAAISACEKGQQWHCALRLLKEMRSGGISANVISYNASISACEKGHARATHLSERHQLQRLHERLREGTAVGEGAAAVF